MTGFQRQVLTPAAHSAMRRGDDENVEWRQKIRSERDRMMTPPVQVQPEPPVELLACVLYNTPAWQAAREAAAQVAQVETESKPPRPRRANGESKQ